MLCKQCLGNLRSEVSKIYNKRVTSCFLDILKSLYHVDLALYDTDRTFVNIRVSVFFFVCFHQSFSSAYRQALRKTISAHCNNSDFQFWHVIHCNTSFLCFLGFLCFIFASFFTLPVFSRLRSRYSRLSIRKTHRQFRLPHGRSAIYSLR